MLCSIKLIKTEFRNLSVTLKTHNIAKDGIISAANFGKNG